MNGSPLLRELFFSFFRLGLTAFGGPAMVAHIGRMAVEKKKWLDDASFRSGVVLCQMIPGATAMQSAAYVGLQSRGLPGAAASFIGFGLPAFLFMLVLSFVYQRMHGLLAVVSVFNGLRAIVIAIVANAALTFGRSWIKDWRGGFIALAAAVLFGLGMHPIGVILIAGLCGSAFRDTQAFAPMVKAENGISYTAKSLIMVVLCALGLLILLFFFRRSLFDLAFLMMRIDLFAFGGGFSSLPLMYNEFVVARSWMDSVTFLNGIAMGQITPGPIVITATFVGYMLYGLVGSAVATISIFLPSFLIVVGMAPYYERLRSKIYFDRALQGILYSFVGLLLSVTLRFALEVQWDIIRVVLCCGAFIALICRIDITCVVIVGIVISIFLC